MENRRKQPNWFELILFLFGVYIIVDGMVPKSKIVRYNPSDSVPIGMFFIGFAVISGLGECATADDYASFPRR